VSSPRGISTAKGARIVGVLTEKVKTNAGSVVAVERLQLDDGRTITFRVHECFAGYAVSGQVWPRFPLAAGIGNG
jgi:hypothetical protein